jgi:hypothetical protein
MVSASADRHMDGTVTALARKLAGEDLGLLGIVQVMTEALRPPNLSSGRAGIIPENTMPPSPPSSLNRKCQSRMNGRCGHSTSS